MPGIDVIGYTATHGTSGHGRGWRVAPLVFDSIALVLSLVTWFAFAEVDAYRDISGELLANPSFDAGLAGWRPSRQVRRDQAGIIDLSGSSPEESHVIDQTFARPASGFVRVTADARLRDVVQGAEGWEKARVDLLGLDHSGRWRWDFDHVLFAETGSQDLKGYSRVFHIPARFSHIRIEAELTGATGTYLVDRLSVREVERRPIIGPVKWAILGAWVAFLAVVLLVLVRVGAWWPLAILGSGGALMLFIPNDLRLWVESFITFPDLHLSLDHFTLFLFMTFVVLGLTPRFSPKAAPILHLAVLGVAVEALQYYVPGRDSEFVDMFSDFLGIGFGLLVYTTWVRIRPSGQLCGQLHL